MNFSLNSARANKSFLCIVIHSQGPGAANSFNHLVGLLGNKNGYGDLSSDPPPPRFVRVKL